MDTRSAFLSTSKTLLRAMHELACYRIVGNTTSVAVLSVNVQDVEAYAGATTPAIVALRQVNAAEFNAFHLLFNESSIVLAFSWLDTYLSEVEEAMFLHDPASLGESVEIKLGKVLSCASLDELIHDLARKRARERSQWGLKNRINELKKRHAFQVDTSDADLEWMSDFRNNLVHNRRVGAFKTHRGKVQYAEMDRREAKASAEVRRFMFLTFSLLSHLYVSCAAQLAISRRFPHHRQNLELIERFSRAWPADA